jgi:hypothetical protein
MVHPSLSPAKTGLAAFAAVLAALMPATLEAQEREPLPDYVIEEFGRPPAVPDGPLPEALQRAAQVVFVDTIEQGAWTADQQLALDEIVAAGDPVLPGRSVT